MDFSGALLSGLLTIVAYTVIFMGVYKLYQIATDIRAIKDLMIVARRNPLGVTEVTPSASLVLASDVTKDLLAEDSATAYAQSLLRAVNPESNGAVNEPHEVR